MATSSALVPPSLAFRISEFPWSSGESLPDRYTCKYKYKSDPVQGR
jgi:hypothetical protein